MKILLTNDDGVDASGILAAKEAVSEFGETFVVAPANQKSGIGHALSINEPLRLNKVKLRDNSIAYSVSGTPTDAVSLGIYEVMKSFGYTYQDELGDTYYSKILRNICVKYPNIARKIKYFTRLPRTHVGCRKSRNKIWCCFCTKCNLFIL